MEELIIKYLKETATHREKQQLFEWLKSEESNKILFRDIQKIWLASDNVFQKESEINKAYLRFKGSVENYERGKKPVFRLPLFRTVAAASILIAIFSLGGFFIGKHSSQSTELQAQVLNNVIIGKDNKGTVTLPDGTVVWLNSESKLTYPENFSKEARVVKLEGEGYFDVVKNPNKPFYVETDGLKIRVLGTKFDVKNYKGRETMETTLLSGKVEVFMNNTNNSIILKPNEKLIYNKQQSNYDVKVLDVHNQIIWIEDRLIFSNERFADILKKMEGWYGVEITCDDKINLDQKLSFAIRKESKEEIFELISLIMPIKVEIGQESIKIKRK